MSAPRAPLDVGPLDVGPLRLGPLRLGPRRLEAALRGLRAEPYPPRHQLHKYWGKKPANVVERLVELHTRPGELVLDPFAGSGVTVVEAVRLGRRAQGVELSPVAVRLGRLLLDPPPPARVAEAAERVIARLRPRAAELYAVRCGACAAETEARAFVWEGSELAAVEGACGRCGARIDRAASREDRARAVPRGAPPAHPDAPVPDAWQMRKLHRAGLRRMSELFTWRNLAMLAALRAELEGPGLDRGVREALKLTFTANLAQCSRMIADFRGRAGGPSWKLNSYWVPKRSKELHVLEYFENRVGKTVRALEDLAASRAGRAVGAGAVHHGDARALPLEAGAVDYVFTDPPYGGEGIQYGELTYLWNLWLGEVEALEREITFNPGRNKSLEAYGQDLEAAFAECRRVLRPRRFATVAFANREARVWAVLEGALRRAGFEKIAETELSRSAPGLTERVAARTTKADRLLHYRAR